LKKIRVTVPEDVWDIIKIDQEELLNIARKEWAEYKRNKKNDFKSNIE